MRKILIALAMAAALAGGAMATAAVTTLADGATTSRTYHDY